MSLYREAEDMCYKGTLVNDVSASGGRFVRLSDADDKLFGPYEHVPGGIYTAYFRMKVGSNASANRIATLDVYGRNRLGQEKWYKTREISPNIFASAETWFEIGVPDIEITEGDYDTELRVRDFVPGITTLDIDWAQLFPISLAGNWRDVDLGQIYANANIQLSGGGYWEYVHNPPKDAVVAYRVSISVGDTGIQHMVFDMELRDSVYTDQTPSVVAWEREGKHDWEATQLYIRTIRGYTGPVNGNSVPRFRLYVGNPDGQAVTIGVGIRYRQSPLINI